MIREVEITREDIEGAKARAKEFRRISKDSFLHGKGNAMGLLGERLVEKYTGAKFAESNKDFDVWLNGKRVEVKTKRCWSPPKPYYNCSVYITSDHQQCDAYIFVRIQFDKVTKKVVKGWIMGQIDRDEFYANAVIDKRGEIDPNSTQTHAYDYPKDCRNLPANRIYDVEIEGVVAP